VKEVYDNEVRRHHGATATLRRSMQTAVRSDGCARLRDNDYPYDE